LVQLVPKSRGRTTAHMVAHTTDPDQDRIVYPAHLKWSCIRCTRSCRDVPSRKRNILLTSRDIDRIASVSRFRREDFSVASGLGFPYERRMKKVRSRCMFLRGSECSIYNARPLICRFYPFFLERLEGGQLRIGFDGACSGVGKGKFRNEGFFRELVRLARRELTPEWTSLAEDEQSSC